MIDGLGYLLRSADMTQEKRKSRQPTKWAAKISILEPAGRFGDPKVAEAWLWEQPWSNGVRCPSRGKDGPQ